MFITVKKRNISIGIIIVVLAISAYLNFRTVNNDATHVASDVIYEEKEIKTGEAIMVSGKADAMLEARNNREIVRSKACDLLTKTMKDVGASSDARQKAENALLRMAEDMDKENECESLLAAKGFAQCVVFVSEDSVNVTVNKKDISETDVAKINDIVSSVTNLDNIKIISLK